MGLRPFFVTGLFFCSGKKAFKSFQDRRDGRDIMVPKGFIGYLYIVRVDENNRWIKMHTVTSTSSKALILAQAMFLLISSYWYEG